VNSTPSKRGLLVASAPFLVGREAVMEDVVVRFGGGKRVEAKVGKFVVVTDQPASLGGAESAPGPFDLFLASLATCTGFYVLGFCQARGLSVEGIELRQHVELGTETKLPARIELHLTLPPTFPEKYRVAVARAAEHCKVKKTIAARPTVAVVMDVAEPVARAS
jgi:ribosomal protein S12 methylthiotransferase accessory factor